MTCCLRLLGLAAILSTACYAPIASADTNAETDSLAAAPKQVANDLLTIGSPAPELDIEHWVQDGGGRFQPVTKFEPGKVYVIEFWATWCGPCVQSMPYLSDLQARYVDQGLTIISISREPLETVTSFLQREARDLSDNQGNPIIYDEITKGYCLTTDPDNSSNNDYMKAADRRGIPCAFLVGKDGHIEWIGHPMALDEPLNKVINDSWDREAFGLAFKFQARLEQLPAFLGRAEFDEGMAKIDELVAEAPTPELAAQVERLRISVFVNQFGSLLKSDPDAALKLIPELLEKVESEAEVLFSLTRFVVSDQDVEADSPVVAELIKRVQALHESDQKDFRSALTLSFLKKKQSDLQQALKYCEEGVELADNRIKGALRQLADQMRKELESSREEGAQEEGSAGDEVQPAAE